MMPAFGWNVLAWAMWGVFLLCFRYALERRRQECEQDAALQAIEASLEIANEPQLDVRPSMEAHHLLYAYLSVWVAWHGCRADTPLGSL
jgi:hypothetical protein